MKENENQLRRDCFLPFWKKSKLIKISPQENIQISFLISLPVLVENNSM